MGNIIQRITKAVAVTVFAVIIAGCTSHNGSASAVAREPVKLSAWMAYWDVNNGETDLQKAASKLEKLSFFGAYFDKMDRLFIPQELIDKKNEWKKQKGKYDTYLTIVNDRKNFDESLVLKDIEVLRRVWANDAAMERHIEEIIELTLRHGYDGVEIDYERIWKDNDIGQSFVKFIHKLQAAAAKNNLKMRVVLEPRTPFSSAQFPKGPEYVVMVYNLYGLHSSPGPKANKAFIQKTVNQMKALPGEKAVAFSTGGCLWGSNGEKRFITEVEAKTLAVTHDAGTKRDEESQALLFEYKDKGVAYQVWYADVKTLQYWIAVAGELGVSKVSIWRLGGNIDIDQLQ